MKECDITITNYWNGLRVNTIDNDNPYEVCSEEEQEKVEETQDPEIEIAK